MFYGTIKRIDREKGFGFIQVERGPDVFFLVKVVDDGGLNVLMPRQAVSYELEKTDPETDRGPRARKVLIIDRLPGGELPPPPEQLQVKHHPKARQKKPTWRR